VIEVRGGVYPGPLVVEKSVTLAGVDWPVIDNGGRGTVVTLAAPGIVFRGFEVRGSGTEPDRDHAGIAVTAPTVVVENNHVQDVLFGVFVAQADDVVVRSNDITSKAEFDSGRKGDGIRLWYSARVTVEGNHVHEARDVVLWYAEEVNVRHNLIERGRYGVHLMYSNNARVEHNQLLDNSVGLYAMYSRGVVLRANDLRRHRGPSGYALGFKDTDDITVADNLLADNRAGIFLDGTPFNPQSYARFTGNVVAANDVGVVLLPAVRGNQFTDNAFWENVQQVSVQGGAASVSAQNEWRGNYWSDYAGFDATGDGVGDVPYRADHVFESLTDREPVLRALIYSPASQAVEFAASAFPIFKPQPRLVDPAPRMEPVALPPGPVPSSQKSAELALAALALLGAGGACGMLAVQGGSSMSKTILTADPGRAKGPLWAARQGKWNAEFAENLFSPSANSALSAVQLPSVKVQNVSKRYGNVVALEGVSFEARAGEAIALWGANGAGKSTLLKAILSLINFEGAIQIEGHDVRRAGKAARRCIGYVPQEVMFYDQSVQATMEFYARLKEIRECPSSSRSVQSPREASNLHAKRPIQRIPHLLERLGLAKHAHKSVPALSGGLRQRLALAIALLADPPVLLLDEPTASLDACAQRDYLSLLTLLRKEEHKTILFASHRLEEVELLANRVLVLEQGRLVEMLTPIDLLTRLMPEIELTLWVPEASRPEAVACLTRVGLTAHLNGRGTVVVQVRGEHKMRAFETLQAQGIPVLDFQTRGGLWN
jgi:nitrous oxidase accessory protein